MSSVDLNDRTKCVVLVPVASHIEPTCEAALVELAKRGYAVRRVYGYAAIDQARNEMAAAALADGYEETLWIRNERRAGISSPAVEGAKSTGLPSDDLIDLGFAIEKLPGECRAVVELYWHGWRIAEIAKKLGLSQTHVHRALHKGLALLK